MKKAILFGIIAIILVTSCKKDDLNEVTSDYTPMNIGNYWVYEHYSIDTVGIENKLSIVDSLIISRDTLINGNLYYVFEGTNNPFNPEWAIVNILRDSADYLINNRGEKIFSLSNFTEILLTKTGIGNSDTLYVLSYKMEENICNYSVPAGSFTNLLNYKGILVSDYENIPKQRIMNNYYVENVGKILETYFYLSQPTVYEKRLVRYNIE